MSTTVRRADATPDAKRPPMPAPGPHHGAGQTLFARALVINGDSEPGSTLVRQLTARGTVVVGAATPAGASHEDGDVAHLEHLVRLPDADSPEYIPALARTLERFNIDLLIPAGGPELPAIAIAKNLLEATGAAVLVPGIAPLSLTDDRLAGLAHLRSRGVPVPDFTTPSSAGDIDTALEVLGGAFLARPRRSLSSRAHSMIVTRPTDFGDHVFDDRWVLSAVQPGVQFAVALHRPPSGRERREVIVQREGIRLPLEHGAQFMTTTDPEPLAAHAMPEVERTALATIRAIGLTGAATVSVRVSPEGEPMVINVEPRLAPTVARAPRVLEAALGSLHEQKLARRR